MLGRRAGGHRHPCGGVTESMLCGFPCRRGCRLGRRTPLRPAGVRAPSTSLFLFIRRRWAAERQGCIQVGPAAGKCLPGHELLELASVCARIHMAVRARPSPCTRGSGVLAPMAVVEYWAGLRAREGLLMFSALPQQPWPPNSRSAHPPARADQTSRWPARRSWQKGGQVLKV